MHIVRDRVVFMLLIHMGAVTFGGGEVGPHLTQCCQAGGLPPYQVAPWSIQPFGHNRHGPRIIRTQAKPAPVNFECAGCFAHETGSLTKIGNCRLINSLNYNADFQWIAKRLSDRNQSNVQRRNLLLPFGIWNNTVTRITSVVPAVWSVRCLCVCV